MSIEAENMVATKSFAPPLTAQRRGRPRKNSPLQKQTPPTPPPPPSQQSNSNSLKGAFDKPREELSYKDFFPDLDIREPLAIVKVPEPSVKQSDYIKQTTPIPNSPSIDEYETASEGESSPVAMTHKLPIPSYQKIKPPNRKSKKEDNSSSTQLFHRPDNHYIRYIEPSETELFATVEYDMDEQDEVWLQIYNKERKKENSGQVSGELFEAVIDQLEKEWFNLIKNLPKKTAEDPVLPEDSKCAVCDDGECENSNAIVFCDGCNLAVHQDCYGIPYIPEGQWLCRKCMVSPENPVSCIFCPGEGGAFKQTTTNQWGHLLCAIWIPEVSLSNSVYMEPIDNIESVPKSRWKLSCYICRRRHGACIQCDNKHCFVAFHVTCARWARLCMRMKLHGTHYDGVVLKAYCDRHTPRDYKDNVDVDANLAIAQQWFIDHKHGMPRRRYVDEEDDDLVDYNMQQQKTKLLPTSKAARAHQHQYTAGAPIAPEYILDKLENLQCVRQTKLKKKASLITSICRYWSLKRESRRGAPLLKRLHLEPWTASSSELKQSEVEKAHKASSMMSLRADLEKVRMLTEQVQKRERHKLDRVRKQKAYIEMILYPVEFIVHPILRQLMAMDKKDFFKYPVPVELAPDYYDVIKEPMSFSDIQEKLALHRYSTVDEFEYDLNLIWKNCMFYNKRETLYFKLAQKLQKHSQELIAEAQEDFHTLQIRNESGALDVDIDPGIFEYGIAADASEKENVPDLSSVSSLSSAVELSQSTSSGSNSSIGGSNSAHTKSAPTSNGDAPNGIKKRTRSGIKALKQLNTRSLRSRQVDQSLPEQPSSHTSSTSPSLSPSASSSAAATSLRKRKRTASPMGSEPQPAASQTSTSRNQSSKRSRNISPVQQKAKSKEQTIDKYFNKQNTTKKHANEQPAEVSGATAATTKNPALATKATASLPPVRFTDGELVWARVRGFPPHPASIIDPKTSKKKIPENVLALTKTDKNHVLVEFFQVSDSHMWGWIEKKEINPFGNLDVDKDMLLIAKRSKKSYRIKEVKSGYKYACKLVHIDPSVALAQIFKNY
ncbi:PHD-zinc-finger like domain-containing protein [Parasitella parasitica]|nr:PHD-zinc-finger like domain-containing protein [Parasitella parasitica]